MIQPIKPYLYAVIQRLDVIAAVAGSLVGAIIVVASLTELINQISVGLVILVSSSGYLLLRNRLGREKGGELSLSPSLRQGLTIAFFTIVSISTLIWYNQLYARPLSYFVLIAFLAGLVSIDIVAHHEGARVWPILLKIFILVGMIRMGIYYNFPSIMGYDGFTHTMIANLISSIGFVPPFDISGKYVSYPILHIFLSTAQIITDVDIKDAVWLSLGLVSIISTLFLYLVGNRISSEKVGLLSILIFGLSSQIITLGITNITAGSLAICYFLVILYLIINEKNSSKIFVVLLLLISIMVILTHQLSAFVILLSLTLLVLSVFLFSYIYRNDAIRSHLPLVILPFFSVSMIYYWFSTNAQPDQSFFETVLSPLIDIIQAGGGAYGSDVLIIGHEYARPLIETVVLQSSYLIIPLFAIGGIYYWLSKKDISKVSLALSTGVLFFLVYAIPLLGIRNLLTSRWMPFLGVFLAVLAAVFIIMCFRLIPSRPLKFVSVFLVVTIIAILMIMTPGIDKDSPIVAKDTTIRNQFTLNEIEAIGTLHVIYEGDYVVDSVFKNAFVFYGVEATVEGQRKRMNSIGSFNDERFLEYLPQNPNSLLVLRKSTSTEPITQEASDLYGDVFAAPLSPSFFQSIDESNTKNLIYTNGNIIAYA